MLKYVNNLRKHSSNTPDDLPKTCSMGSKASIMWCQSKNTNKQPHIDLVQKSIQPHVFELLQQKRHGWYIDYIDVGCFWTPPSQAMNPAPTVAGLGGFPKLSTLKSWLKKWWSVMKVHHRCQLGWVSHSWISMALQDVKRPRNSFGLTVATNCVTG